ncbi:MAG: HAMP domain-containing histidine kinase [Chloroflexota bacterium]|nr:HAMP domain-containing histidine kinase [Chloroflexota bacterium]
MTRGEEQAGEDRVRELIAAVNDELVNALRRADALRVEADAAREAVQSAAEERLRFFQYANHDMRTPLAVMLGLVQLARRRVAKGDYSDTASALEKIEAQVERLTELTDRAFRLTEKEGSAPDQVVDLSTIATEAVYRLRDNNASYRIDLREIGTPLPVMGDPGELADVLENLVLNAVKYSPEGGAVTVSAEIQREPDRSMALVRVTDEGAGIPEEHQPLLFEAFYRAPAARGVPGSGLGLAICADVIARHEGRIWLEHSSDQGSTFAFVVPLVAAGPG